MLYSMVTIASMSVRNAERSVECKPMLNELLCCREECRRQVDKFPQARYKKFGTRNEAQDFIEDAGPGPVKG